MNTIAPPPLQSPTDTASKRLLSTTSVPENQRFAYWLDMICAVYVQLDCEEDNDRHLFGDIEVSRLGSLDLTHLRSNARRVRRTPPQIRKTTEDYCLVQVQREGKMVVCQDGRLAVVNPGDFVMYDCTRPYELICDDQHHDVFVMRLPRVQLEGHVGNLEELTATTITGQDAAGHLLLSMVETLRRDIDRLHPSSALGVSDAITNIVAAGLRGLPGANVRKSSNLQTYHVARISAYVKEHLRDPELSINSIAVALQVSPDHLSRIFRSEPIALSRVIWKMRLDGCRRDLADPRMRARSVSEIAFSWGFNNAAHFSRSFKEEYGISPSEWQRSKTTCGS